MSGKGKLFGRKIVIAGSRKTDEMSLLIEKQGGIPIIRSLQGLVYVDEPAVEQDLKYCVGNKLDWFICTTGTGTEALIHAASKLGIDGALLQQMKTCLIASRGYKTYSKLKNLGMKPDVVDEDGTTEGLIRALSPYQFKDQRVAVQLHGEPQPTLVQFLEERGAHVTPLLLYKHIAPDPATLELLCNELTAGQVDAVCFTTAVQVRYLFHYARANNRENAIKAAFGGQVRAVAVGKVTAEALREEGINLVIAPESERMGAMIIGLVNHYNSYKDKLNKAE
ncbi:uroporphyrinogen-III synthase [Paenibacillus agricola]|uniref:Uroporphyrinogen-III synthase n=1 Tax=Paenibacillus agricola TaxID=2716264 RepID=A0ABX0IZN9_9BACL|nr:uroporphyrinogen-III synthase [Paenibacillus agricola]NHN29031.1 uroporphyrinogen-III synthase [Paenibacillus agricola]